MAKELVFVYTVYDSDEYDQEDLDDVVNSIERDLESSDGPGQMLCFRGVREVED